MDSHAIDHYSSYSDETSYSHFYRVIALHDNEDLNWKEVSKLAPDLCKGWYELAHLSIQDRIDFIREFWLAKLPYHLHLNEGLSTFFSSLDDIGIFLTQAFDNEEFESHIVYSLAGNSGFFHGEAGANEQEIIALQKVFPEYILPVDYLAFLQIHNGFAKLTDTGLTKSIKMQESYEEFQKLLESQDFILTGEGKVVNPKSLIPFYKSFGMAFFQCFWGEWYPGTEMGNVYYSSIDRTISDCTKTDDPIEAMAFETFIDWLLFYLEKID
jgi:hypothetical protein